MSANVTTSKPASVTAPSVVGAGVDYQLAVWQNIFSSALAHASKLPGGQGCITVYSQAGSILAQPTDVTVVGASEKVTPAEKLASFVTSGIRGRDTAKALAKKYPGCVVVFASHAARKSADTGTSTTSIVAWVLDRLIEYYDLESTYSYEFKPTRTAKKSTDKVVLEGW